MPTYFELLKDPRWQRKRLEILERDGWKCQACLDDKQTLHVHHRHYQSGLKPWEYDNDVLVTLCEDCHEATTNTKKLLDIAVGKLINGFDEMVLGFAETLLAVLDDKPRIVVRESQYTEGVAAMLIMASQPGKAILTGASLLERSRKTAGLISPMDIVRSLATTAEEPEG